MPWLHVSPGHQQPWYWPCRMKGSIMGPCLPWGRISMIKLSSQCWEMIEMGQIKFCGSQNNFMMTRVKIPLLTVQPHHPEWNLWKIQLSEIHWKYMWKCLIIISMLINMKNIHFQWASYFWSWLVRPAVQRSSIQSDIYQVQDNFEDFKALSNGIIETGVTV